MGRFANWTAYRIGIYLPARKQVLCTLQRAMWLFSEKIRTPPKDFRLSTLCSYFGVPVHAADVHEALSDAIATMALYKVLRTCEVSNGRAEHILTVKQQQVAVSYPQIRNTLLYPV
jgi:DNA polymerase III epsilon subunit-like protein